ncbi:hypothetical protein ACLKA7_010336 [Drosophila subpalustris]
MMERASSPLLLAQSVLPMHHQPKGRGRPRASYAQTGEFDLGLIREYRSRPALYDRTNKRFKDKIYVAQLWMQISHKLGYDVSMLRERMITLRNRYNIEKRRVENSSMTANFMGSQWPLFENLSFLSEHIRSRRSYKTQSRHDGHHDDDDDEEPYDVDDMTGEINGHVKRIKHEMDADYEDGDPFDCDRQMPVTTVLNIPGNTQIMSQEDYSTQLNGSDNVNGKRLLEGLRQPELVMAAAKQKRVQSMPEAGPQANKRRLDASNSTDTATATASTSAATSLTGLAAAASTAASSASTTTVGPAYPKFRAFGEFVSHSLAELPVSVSMRLVEAFTRDLVQAAITNEQSQQTQTQAETQTQTQSQTKPDSAEQSSMDEADD